MGYKVIRVKLDGVIREVIIFEDGHVFLNKNDDCEETGIYGGYRSVKDLEDAIIRRKKVLSVVGI